MASIKAKNFLSSLFFLVISYLLVLSFHKSILNRSYEISGLLIELRSVFDFIFWSYAVVLFAVCFLSKKNETGKGLLAARAAKKIIRNPIKCFSEGIPKDEKTAILAVVVKFFFTPLVIGWLFSNGFAFYSNANELLNSGNIFENFVGAFEKNIFWMVFNFVLLVDVLFFSLGYLLEFSFLKNKILSVEPTFLGWFVTLACYPPFNSYANSAIGWSSSDFAAFESKHALILANIAILALMGVFAWASASLGFKASNLTHRGIVNKGPYRFIRHPAYACKTAAWWIGGIPFLIAASKTGIFAIVVTLIPLIIWSVIYFLRAMTEERHLRSVNSEYEKYSSKVKFRFVPGVI